MKENPTCYSSVVGESWHHLMMKVKYCYKIFDMGEVYKFSLFIPNIAIKRIFISLNSC